MDQAKFAVPRHLPEEKALQDCMRPRLHVIGVIAAGFFKAGFIVDPTIPKDADLWIEVVVRALTMVIAICKERHIDVPRRLVIVSDNAGDNKNNHTFTNSAILVGGWSFDVIMNLFLRSGHSHEDIDAMFGQWSTMLIRQPTLQTPLAFKIALETYFPDSTFVILSHVRLFCNWFAECMVSITGMFGSVGSAHSFVFVRRGSYDAQQYGQPDNNFNELPLDGDVVLIPRKYMHSAGVCQQPLVVLPRARLQQFVDGPVRRPGIAPRLVYSADQKKSLKQTADRVSEFPFLLLEASAYLHALADGATNFWATEPHAISVCTFEQPQLARRIDAPGHWLVPANTIEPPQTARTLKARPVAKKYVRTRKKGRGRMSAQVADAAPPPLADAGGVVYAIDVDGDIVQQ